MQIERPRWRWSLAAVVALMVAAYAVPKLTGLEVHNGPRGATSFPPLYASVDPRVAASSVAAVAIALALALYGRRIATTARWGSLLALTWAGAALWMASLAAIDGVDGFTTIGDSAEYLDTARSVAGVGDFLSGFIDRIPLDAAGNWPVHVAGHPPGAVLFFTLLLRLGFTSAFAIGLVVIALAATIPTAIMIALRALGSVSAARRAAPFLVASPAAIWLAVSGDAVFAFASTWAICLLALACTAASRGRRFALALAAGLALGGCAFLSYGLVLIGLVALGVAVASRTLAPLIIATITAGLVVLAVAYAGFPLWEALPVLHDRYWSGLASRRPGAYWIFGNLASLSFAAGPPVMMALAYLRRGSTRAAVWLALGGVVAVAAADLSLMSKAEVERIWLPFVPWLTVASALLPSRVRNAALCGTVTFTLAVAHLLAIPW